MKVELLPAKTDIESNLIGLDAPCVCLNGLLFC